MSVNFQLLARQTTQRTINPERGRMLALITYWRACLVSRQFAAVSAPNNFDPILVGLQTNHNDLDGNYWQSFSVEDFRQGIPPVGFAEAVFARLDAKIDLLNQKRASLKPPKPALLYPDVFPVECAPITIAGLNAGRNLIKEHPAYASMLVVRASRMGPYSLAPSERHEGMPPAVWLSRRNFAESNFSSRIVQFGQFADYLDYIGRAAWLISSWADLVGFFDGSWCVATGSDWQTWRNRMTIVGTKVATGWIREGVSDFSSATFIRQFDDLREWIAHDNDASAFVSFCTSRTRVALTTEHRQSSVLLGHIGAMCLSPSQRDAAVAFAILPSGNIQSVSGPPGTGKTALLRSVLANCVVESAVVGREPALMLATGATNQAVTNIIEAFDDNGNVNATYYGLFSRRWLLDLSSYGTYVRASSRVAREDWSSQIIVFNPASAIAAVTSSHPPSFEHLDAARNAMRRTYRAGEVLFRDIVIRSVHDPEFVAYWLACASKAMNTNFASQADAQQELQRLLALCIAAIRDAEAAIIAWESDADRSAASRTQLRAQIYLLAYGEDYAHTDRFRLLEKNMIDYGDFAATMRGLVDLTMRSVAFHIASRWWEGEFLRRAKVFRFNADRSEIWRLLACLTPCIAGTFDRLATAFTRWNRSSVKTMWGEADIVIVDEAGQASCDRGAAAFAYASRGLVVGDVLQIPPVEGDDAVMWGSVVARRLGVLDQDSLDRGFLSGVVPEAPIAMFGQIQTSEGSVMRAGAAASYFYSAATARIGLGLCLVDHFRCRPGVIAYSNAGWYGQILVPRRRETGFAYPEFLHVDVRDDLLPSTSRRNLVETQAAAVWLAREQATILLATGVASLDRAVAVVTPFREQALEMRKALVRMFPLTGARITCGTLHALQGAERPIVIFLTGYSGAYFTGDQERVYFFDRQGTLLNVAVSRARETLVIIGDRRVFDLARPGTPTHALRSYFSPTSAPRPTASFLS